MCFFRVHRLDVILNAVKDLLLLICVRLRRSRVLNLCNLRESVDHCWPPVVSPRRSAGRYSASASFTM